MKTRILFTIKALLIAGSMTLFLPAGAQNLLQKARQLKAEYDYHQAAIFYNDHLKNTVDPATGDIRSLAECYIMMNDTRLAEEWLGKVVAAADAQPDDVLAYAQVLKTNGKYNEAIDQFRKYASLKLDEASRVAEWITACDNAMAWITDPVYYDVTNAGFFNSEYSDFGTLAFDGGFIFASDRRNDRTTYDDKEIYGWTGNPYLQLYFIPGIESGGALPALISGLNNDFHNAVAVYDEGSKTLYFTRTRQVKVTKKPVNSDPTSWYDRSAAADYTNRLEIYSAKYVNGKWADIKPFRYNNAEAYSVGHPAISPDGRILYFVSDMDGGYGSTDIYFSEKLSDGQWGTPKNAGSGVNTSDKEAFPNVSADGTLYFSSDGWSGMGGLDIFSAIGSRTSWSLPENLRYPFNSPRDDFSIIFTGDGNTGYLSSNRDGGKGQDDIYSFVSSPPKTLVLVGTTKARLEDNSIVPLAFVDLKYMDEAAGEILQAASGADGKFILSLDCGSKYQFKGTKEGYFSAAVAAGAECLTRNDTVYVELVMDKIIINKPIVLENIYYDYNKWNIRSDAAMELDKLVRILVDNPFISIELGSHTDARGTMDYNRKLSQRRAESAVAYIISRGISSDRITAKGYGESVPVNKCVDGVYCSEEDHQMNRRTEFKVTSFTRDQVNNLRSNDVQ